MIPKDENSQKQIPVNSVKIYCTDMDNFMKESGKIMYTCQVEHEKRKSISPQPTTFRQARTLLR
jgi:hypothetical protein